jgi:hypothetical protein
MISLTPSSTCKSEAILDRSCSPYDSSDSDENVISLLSRLGDGGGESSGESNGGKNLDLVLAESTFDSDPTSKQARIGVQSSLT